MKIIITILAAICLAITPLASFAGKGGGGGGGNKEPSQKAYQKADPKAMFMREENAKPSGDAIRQKKRERVEAVKGEGQGKGNQERHKKREHKEGQQTD